MPIFLIVCSHLYRISNSQWSLFIVYVHAVAIMNVWNL